MSCYGAKVGDVIIGNQLANTWYTVTRKNWIGIITDIDNWKGKFTAKNIENGDRFANLKCECFDLIGCFTAQELAKELGFKMEEIL